MKIYGFERKEVIPISIDEAWKFFSNPNNLRIITPPDLGLTITSEAEEKIYPGMIITYSVNLLPFVKSGWTTEITYVDAPGYFVDEQRFGPYKFWHHKHFFTDLGEKTEVRDLVHYALPGWVLGKAANFLFIRRKLDYIFDFRSSRLRKLFGN